MPPNLTFESFAGEVFVFNSSPQNKNNIDVRLETKEGRDSRKTKISKKQRHKKKTYKDRVQRKIKFQQF